MIEPRAAGDPRERIGAGDLPLPQCERRHPIRYTPVMTPEVRERYLTAMNRIEQCTSNVVRPATEDELVRLRAAGFPNAVLELFELAVLDSWHENAFLFGNPDLILIEHAPGTIGSELRAHGFLPIGAIPLAGDVLALDTQSPPHPEDGLPRVVEFSHENDWSQATPADLAACFEVASSFLEFLEQLAGIRPYRRRTPR